MPAIANTRLSNDQYQELGAAIRGQVHLRDEAEFVEYSSIFNGNVVCIAKAVALPLDAEDVSKIILFCSKHSLSLSVKAGGYGTGGWAIGGDIICDVSKLIDIDIEASTAGLREQDAANKLKDNGPSGKRRREEDSALRFYDSASETVANFLRGPYQVGWDTPQTVRRRIEEPIAPPPPPHHDFDSGGSDSSSDDSHDVTRSNSNSTGASPSPASPPRRGGSRPVVGGDPFGYLNAPTNFPAPAPPSVTQSAYNPRAGPDPWGPRSGPLIANSNLPPVPLNLASQAEPIYPNAYVTFGAGQRQKEVDQYTATHQLESHSLAGPNTTIPYHVPFSAHPVGSGVMLLGGFGFLSRLHGLSIDNLVEAEVVTADGQIRIVNKHEHPDLWWGLRGAGTALGIVTRYKAKAFPVPVVFAGNLLYRFHRATAPSLIRHFRDCVKGAPRELYANVLLTAGPEGKDSLIVEKGQEYLLALSSWEGERCLLNEVNEKSFLHQQDSMAQVLRGKPGRQWFIRSALITSLPDEIINETVMQFADTPVGCTWLFELAGGALPEHAEDSCMPKSQREASFNIAALHQWEMTVDDDRCIDSAEEASSAYPSRFDFSSAPALTHPSFTSGSPAPSSPSKAAGPCPASSAATSQRIAPLGATEITGIVLVEIKKKYDPKNIFRHSMWPLDANQQKVDPRTHEPPTPHHLKFGH
ncbi:hypothetical protein C8F04DRAFT_1260914 [Mycena alexandri]|uniref:FAD-binding PCMH-type domain-containing protein n=1 Tax=Mycena alexandri TaxID=1745969 RepID=A0AAD6SU01_9AGAR|nr:hypothetical protein C8F04DRAFT_1260914 [Mycena alexandri]